MKMYKESDKMNKVSIVIPVFNGEKYLKQAIASCLNQTYENIELIIVNDGSTDKTEDIILSFKDKRITYLKHKQNRGLPEALNTGFSVAKGDYLTWASDDNYYEKNAIEKMVNFLGRNSIEFVYCDYYKNGKLVKLPDNARGIGACFLYSQKVKEVIGEYEPETRYAEDYDYWIRVSKKFKMYHLDVPLLHYRVHPDSLFSTKRFEIGIVAILVRLKHNIIEVDEATEQFIENRVDKKLYGLRLFSVFGVRFLPTFLTALILKKIFLHHYVSIHEKVGRILDKFQKKEISFKSAKSDLKRCLH